MADTKERSAGPAGGSALDTYFRLSERSTSVGTEIRAGVTTFLVMAYIIFVNPAILGEAGLDPAAVGAATALVAGLLSILMGVVANYPIAMAAGLGINAAVAFGLVIATLLIPAQVRFVPVFVLLADVGLANTMTALILPFGVSAFGTFLIRQALLSVPDSLIEAARMDGASELRIVYGLLAPLLLPTLASFFLFSFVYHWNDYFWPLVMTTDDAVRTLPLGIALLREQGTGVRWHIVMAGNVALSAPALLVFALTQKYLLRAVASRAG